MNGMTRDQRRARQYLRTVIVLIGIIAAAITAATLLGGCSDQQIAAMRNALPGMRTQIESMDEAIGGLQEQLDQAKAYAIAMPPGQDRDDTLKVAAAVQQTIDQVKLRRSQAYDYIVRAETILANADSAPDVLEETGRDVGGQVGGLWGLVTVLATGTVASIWRAIKKGKKAAAGEDVVWAIEAAKINGVVDFNDAETLRRLELMGEQAKALVDAVQAQIAARPATAAPTAA